MSNLINLSASQLGWRAFFNQQLSFEELESCLPARVINIQSSTVQCLSEQGELSVSLPSRQSAELVVGDWVLLDVEKKFVRALDRDVVLYRNVDEDLAVAANINTVFIVAALTQQFDLAKIKESVAIAHSTHVDTVVILTHKDQCADPYVYIDQVQAIRNDLVIECVNAKDQADMQRLLDWCGKGQMIALVGHAESGKTAVKRALLAASGVGAEPLLGQDTANSLFLLGTGGLLLNSPVLQELFTAHHDDGGQDAFAELNRIAKSCRFADCTHTVEPGCAVIKAVEKGIIERSLLKSFQSNQAEFGESADSLAERRAQDKKAGKMSKAMHSISRKNKKESM